MVVSYANFQLLLSNDILLGPVRVIFPARQDGITTEQSQMGRRRLTLWFHLSQRFSSTPLQSTVQPTLSAKHLWVATTAKEMVLAKLTFFADQTIVTVVRVVRITKTTMRVLEFKEFMSVFAWMASTKGKPESALETVKRKEERTY